LEQKDLFDDVGHRKKKELRLGGTGNGNAKTKGNVDKVPAMWLIGQRKGNL